MWYMNVGTTFFRFITNKVAMHAAQRGKMVEFMTVGDERYAFSYCTAFVAESCIRTCFARMHRVFNKQRFLTNVYTFF